MKCIILYSRSLYYTQCTSYIILNKIYYALFNWTHCLYVRMFCVLISNMLYINTHDILINIIRQYNILKYKLRRYIILNIIFGLRYYSYTNSLRRLKFKYIYLLLNLNKLIYIYINLFFIFWYILGRRG